MSFVHIPTRVPGSLKAVVLRDQTYNVRMLYTYIPNIVNMHVTAFSRAAAVTRGLKKYGQVFVI